MEQEEILKAAFLSMKRSEVIDRVQAAIGAGVDPLRILDACQKAMEEVGRKFESGDFFLSELIYSAEAFKSISALLEPLLLAQPVSTVFQGEVVFGTPRGDIHDLGKNIVITMMQAHGFKVHDLGVEVEPRDFILELQRTGAPILALSALITPAFAAMREAIALLEENGLRERTFVIIGGGVTTEFVRKELGADAQTLDPTAAIRMCRDHLRAVGAA